jgi:hypothetical protein
MLSSSHPGVLLAKLKSRGLSGLAVRHRRMTSNDLDQPHPEDDLHTPNIPSQSPSHSESAGDFAPLKSFVSSPGSNSPAAADPESCNLNIDDKSPIATNSPERFAPGAAGA